MWLVTALPPFLKFEGGKGVATGLGVFMVMLPIETLIAVVTWFTAGKLLKVSSISSLIGLSVSFGSSYIIEPEISGIGVQHYMDYLIHNIL